MRMQAAAVALAFLLSACGGGGDGGTTTPPPGGGGDQIAGPEPEGSAPASYTISGKITLAESNWLDADTNDPQQPDYRSNDTPAEAQVVPNPTLLVGHVGFRGQGNPGPNFDNGDMEDYFRVSLQAGQVLELEFSADPSTIDLDLFLFPVAGGNSVGASIGENKYECIRVTRSGDYYVNVSVYAPSSAGGTVYQLRLGAPGSGNSACGVSSTAVVVPGEVIAQVKSSEGVTGKSALPTGMQIARGQAQDGRPVLLTLPADAATTTRTLADLAQKTAIASSTAGASATKQKSAAQLQETYSMLKRNDMNPDVRRTIETMAMTKLLRASGNYDFVELNYEVKTTQSLTGSLPSNDRDYARQRWHYELINLPSAFQALNALNPAPSQRPIVAVIDTGVVLGHPDLSGQMVGGYDFVPASDSGDGDGLDANADDSARANSTPSFHGTHVAGTVAAQGFNTLGGLGVAPMAQIMPIRVLGERSGTTYAVLQGIRFSAGLSNDSGALPARRADVINMSLGSEAPCSTAMSSAVSAARAAGTIVVAATGNDSTTTSLRPIGSPASCAGVISVGAVGPNKTRAQYSNGGSGLWISAPGGDFTNITGNPGGDGIYSTLAEFRNGTRVATFGNLSGTSMASPHVAGVMALMRWVNPAITPAQVDTLIANQTIVDDIGAAGRDASFGFGLVNARKAVEAALAARGGSVPATGRVEAQPSSLSLGSVLSETDLIIDRIGASTETVVSVSASAATITVSPKTTGSVNTTTKLGTYVVRANRASIPTGTAVFPEVVITTSAGRTVRVPVAVENRPGGAVTGNLGPIYLLVYDAKAADDADTIAATFVAQPVNGVYAYSLTVTAPTGTVNPSSIYIYAGADLDNDSLICGPGEACGAYPVLSGLPVRVYPRGNLNNIDFSVAPSGGITPVSVGSTNGQSQGRRRPAFATPAIGVKP
jgi:serine protease